MISGELRDLSHGGAGKIIPDDKVVINRGQLCECVVELPCQEWLYCSVEVCHVTKIDSRKTQIIGTRFVGLSLEQKRLISSCITVLEQEEMRKRNMI
jgi:c-di-GMP-binding flagellar brake protein YcgR